MNTHETLLIEIGTEELPTNDLEHILNSLKDSLKSSLKKNDINFSHIDTFATIRRLTFFIILTHIDHDIKNLQNKIKNTINYSIDNTIFKTNMRWSNNIKTFIRPIKWYVLILNKILINHKIFGIKSKPYTYGHKSQKKPIKININNYHTILEKKGMVITTYEKRKKIIEKKIKFLIKKYKYNILIDKEIFKNIINSLEYPTVLMTNFKKKYLKIPYDFIISTITKQDCIPIFYKNKLTNKIIIVTNSITKNTYNIKNGYTYAINTKLSDTEYLYNLEKNFLKKQKIKNLKKIIFHENLGTMYDKTKRIIKLTKFINTYQKNPSHNTIKSAILLKIDLLTKTITEIPELTGILTAYSLKKYIEIKKILHDYNKVLNNKIPSTQEGAILVISDKIDNITSFFSINKKATSSKDPFNLRRDALIIIKSIINNKINLNIKNLLKYSLKICNYQNKSIIQNIMSLILNRLLFYYQITSLNIFKEKYNIYKLDKLISINKTLFKYKIMNDFVILNKRICKITQKNKIDLLFKFKKNMLLQKDEKDIFQKLKKNLKIINILNRNHLYFESIKTTLNLKKSIENYFKNIIIINTNELIKKNNLKLLNIIKKIFTKYINLNIMT